MKKWKLLSSLSVLGAAALVGLSACGSTANGDSEAGLGQINVVTREDGSGTRGAFIELFGLEEKNSDGEKVDLTTQNAIVTNSTSVMLTTVAEDGSAIGYASLGSLNDSVKVVDIDGAEATVENIKDGSYKVSRPFNIVTKDDTNEAAKDFINFILSSEGQAIVEKSGYIPLDDNGSYKSSVNSGKVVISGSSSVTPVMEKLKENGLLSEDSENFYFPYNEAGKYKLVNYEMLSYLVNTRNSNAIKIYIYLLNKFQWKENYVFTLKELLVAIGYSENSNNSLASQMVK